MGFKKWLLDWMGATPNTELYLDHVQDIQAGRTILLDGAGRPLPPGAHPVYTTAPHNSKGISWKENEYGRQELLARQESNKHRRSRHNE